MNEANTAHNNWEARPSAYANSEGMEARALNAELTDGVALRERMQAGASGEIESGRRKMVALLFNK